MLTDLIDHCRKMKEQMKNTQNEIKQSIQGTNSDRKETGTHIIDLEQKEEINIQPEQNKETRIQKMSCLGTSGTTLSVPTSKSWSAGRRRGRARNWKLIWKNNEGELPNLVKEIDSRESRKLRESQRSWIQGSTHQGTSLLHYPRLKIRRESEKQQEQWKQLPTKEFPWTISWFFKRNHEGKKGLEGSIPSHERQGPTSKITLSSKAVGDCSIWFQRL